MIKIKCDICGKEDNNIDTLVLYRKKIDYCNNIKCKRKIMKIEKEFRKEIKYQNFMFDCALRNKEKRLLKEIKK